MRRDEAGFTLLEVLVALTVMGFLMVGLSQGVRFGLLAWERQSRLVESRSELDAVDRLLRRLIEQMDPGTASAQPRIVGTARGMEFRSDLGPAAGPLGVRDADVQLVVEAGRLLLKWRPHQHAVLFAAPPPLIETELLRGVAGIEIAFWAGDPPAWRAEHRERSLPRLVRLRLRFAEGDRRHWPDMVAAPLRERPPG